MLYWIWCYCSLHCSAYGRALKLQPECGSLWGDLGFNCFQQSKVGQTTVPFIIKYSEIRGKCWGFPVHWGLKCLPTKIREVLWLYLRTTNSVHLCTLYWSYQVFSFFSCRFWKGMRKKRWVIDLYRCGIKIFLGSSSRLFEILKSLLAFFYENQSPYGRLTFLLCMRTSRHMIVMWDKDIPKRRRKIQPKDTSGTLRE